MQPAAEPGHDPVKYNCMKKLGIALVCFALVGCASTEEESTWHERFTPPMVLAAPFVVMGVFMLMERQIEDRLRMSLGQFVRAPILAPGSFEPAARAVNVALCRRDSRLAETVCFLLAIVGTVVTFSNMTGSDVSTWAIRVSGGEHTLTLAGWWAVLISNVIFGFLLLL